MQGEGGENLNFSQDFKFCVLPSASWTVFVITAYGCGKVGFVFHSGRITVLMWSRAGRGSLKLWRKARLSLQTQGRVLHWPQTWLIAASSSWPILTRRSTEASEMLPSSPHQVDTTWSTVVISLISSMLDLTISLLPLLPLSVSLPPSIVNLMFLMSYWSVNRSTSEGVEALQMALHTLRMMALGGIHDHVAQVHTCRCTHSSTVCLYEHALLHSCCCELWDTLVLPV